MTKKRKRKPVFDVAADSESRIHKPKVHRAHLALEMRESNREELVDEVTRHLAPFARDRAAGRQDGYSPHDGWRTKTKIINIGG